MLFLEKENVFMRLIAFQKMFRKIFSNVWLCSWKYHKKHIFYLLLTFSQLPNEYIISFIPKSTNKTQKRSHFLDEIAKRSHFLGEITISIGEIAIAISPISIAIDANRRSSGDHDRDRGALVWIVSFGSVCGSEQSSFERGSACLREEENVWSENMGWNLFPLLLA